MSDWDESEAPPTLDDSPKSSGSPTADSGTRHSNGGAPFFSGKCDTCGGLGHRAAQCPTPADLLSKLSMGMNRRNGEVVRNGQNDVRVWGGGAAASRPTDAWASRRTPNGDSNGFRHQNGDGCFTCGEQGHFSRECPQKGERNGHDNERYIPPEVGDDELFEHGIESGINFTKYDHLEPKVSGHSPPKPITSFNELASIRKLVLENLARAKYSSPTPVQKFALPIIAAGRDMMACAQTGSGKTAAFLVPIISGLLAEGIEPHSGKPAEPQAIIVTPTRELAIQIQREARKFAFGSNVRTQVIYGGTDVGYQKREIVSKPVNILVATMGRLLHFEREGFVSFSKVKYFVLDEADRMVDTGGFMNDVEELVRNPLMPDKSVRQTLMFSATFPQEIQNLAKTFLKETYLYLTVGIVGGACSDVTQAFYQVKLMEKLKKIVDILKSETLKPSEKTLVFVEKKEATDFLATYLSKQGFLATSIHGDRSQRQREEAVRDFTRGRMKVLVGTAVAARGLDIPNIGHVINYDLPKTIDEYVHRIGRTGRVGNTGKATSFYDSRQDSRLAHSLVKILCEAEQAVPDWLQAESSHHGCLSTGGFGGFNHADIRTSKQRNGHFMTTNANDDDEELWD